MVSSSDDIVRCNILLSKIKEGLILLPYRECSNCGSRLDIDGLRVGKDGKYTTIRLTATCPRKSRGLLGKLFSKHSKKNLSLVVKTYGAKTRYYWEED